MLQDIHREQNDPVNNELETALQEVVVACFEVLSPSIFAFLWCYTA
jgi:hypothetical protein